MVWWVLAGCVSGVALRVDEPGPDGAVDVPTVDPVDLEACEPVDGVPDLAPDGLWVLENEYQVLPHVTTFTSDGDLRTIENGWPATETVVVMPEGTTATRVVEGVLMVEGDGTLVGGQSSTLVWQSPGGSEVLTLEEALDTWSAEARVNDGWIVVRGWDALYAYDREQGVLTEHAAQVTWDTWTELDGDLLWTLDASTLTLGRVDLRTGESTSWPVEGGSPDPMWSWSQVFGLAVGPDGPVYTTSDGVRVHLDRQGNALFTSDAGFAAINTDIYGRYWTASPIAWSEAHVAELTPDGIVVVSRRCDGAMVATLEPIEHQRPFSDRTAAISELVWSPDGQNLAVRLETAVAVYTLP
ncbi:MAG: hypothetical protein H6736_25195 [Alphaproteobacteria bacterium]|nr:hypothetical protein [Alphaproteobacteria bacterium]